MPKVEIYTKFLCPYCGRALALLKRKGVSFDEHDITMDTAGRAAMIARADGKTTVPQIFIGDVHVGGSDDLAALDASGALDRMLAG
ncbi:MAG: glutaredoxin 3 [Sphingomonadaceae bacterium]